MQTPAERRPPAEPPHVVIVGGGFGGLTAAQALADAPVRVTVVDRTNHHLFQPLLYEVAMAGLSPADIAQPIRSLVSENANCSVLLAEVTRIDLDGKKVVLDAGEIHYDHLILATGAETTYFGHEEWQRVAPGLKNLQDAVEIRQRVLLSFETAERETDPARLERLLSFVVIGGGATGVELAGALSELSRHVLAKDFRRIDPTRAQVRLIEAGPSILGAFPEPLKKRAIEQLAELGVEVRTGAKVTHIDEDGVTLDGGERIPSSVVIWGAGVRATALTLTLGVPLDRARRVLVEKDCSIPGHPEAFCIGDAACFLHQTGQPLPGTSPTAMQMARFVSGVIARRAAQRPRISDGTAPPAGPREVFRYVDKGSMATIGRSRAIAQLGRLQFSGFTAWMVWLVVHIWFLIGFRNRLVVMMTWFWSYMTYGRGARLITSTDASAAPSAPAPIDVAPAPSHLPGGPAPASVASAALPVVSASTSTAASR